MLIYFTVLESFFIGHRDSCVRGLLARLAQVFSRRLKRILYQHCGSVVVFVVAFSIFCYSALFANGFRVRARCVVKRFVGKFLLV